MLFFFFKQKTAYEMRISDWSSDVCSSDLIRIERRREICGAQLQEIGIIRVVADADDVEGGEHAHIHHRARDLRRQAEQEIAIGDVKNGHPGIGQHHRGRRDADLELPLTAGMRERELFEDRKSTRMNSS